MDQLQARYEQSTKVSLIKQNAQVSRRIEESKIINNNQYNHINSKQRKIQQVYSGQAPAINNNGKSTAAINRDVEDNQLRMKTGEPQQQQQLVLLKRNSPQWVEKIDSAPYMRRDRFVLVRAPHPAPPSRPNYNNSNRDMSPVLNQQRASMAPSSEEMFQKDQDSICINGESPPSSPQRRLRVAAEQQQSRFMLKQGSMSERTMVSKEIVSNILSGDQQQRTQVNNILFPGFSSAASPRNNPQAQQNYEENIMLEHLRQKILANSGSAQDEILHSKSRDNSNEDQAIAHLNSRKSVKPLPLAGLSLSKRTAATNKREQHHAASKDNQSNDQHEVKSGISQGGVKQVDVRLPRENQKAIIMQEGMPKTSNQDHNEGGSMNSQNVMDKQLQQQIDDKYILYDSNSVQPQYTLKTRQLELNLVSLNKQNSQNVDLQINNNNNYQRIKRTTSIKPKQQNQNNQQAHQQKISQTASRRVSNHAHAPNCNFNNNRHQQDHNNLSQDHDQKQIAAASRHLQDHPNIAAIKQRIMTSEGRVSSHNLYGNLTGTQNQRLAATSSIGGSSSSIAGTTNTAVIQHKLHCAKNSIDTTAIASAKPPSQSRNKQQHQLLLSAETLKSENAIDAGQLNNVTNTKVADVVVKSQLPRMVPSKATKNKKPKHILVQEVNAHLYKDLTSDSNENTSNLCESPKVARQQQNSRRNKQQTDEKSLKSNNNNQQRSFSPQKGATTTRNGDRSQQLVSTSNVQTERNLGGATTVTAGAQISGGKEQLQLHRSQIDSSQLDLQRKVENRSYSPQSKRNGQNKIISAITDRSRQIQLAILQSQQNTTTTQHQRSESVRHSGVSQGSSKAEQESILRISREHEGLKQLVNSRRLPTISQIKAAESQLVRQNSSVNETGSGSPSHRQQRALIFETVPSHIVPPRKKQQAVYLENLENKQRKSNMSVHSDKNKSQSQPPRKMRRYAEVKQEMLAQNNDPSRDVLQTLLNPYEGFDDTERQPHPFQIKSKRNSRQLNTSRKNSKITEGNSRSNSLLNANRTVDNQDYGAIGLKEALQQQMQSIASAQALRSPHQERQQRFNNRMPGQVSNISPQNSMQVALDNNGSIVSTVTNTALQQNQQYSSTAKDQLTAGLLQAAQAQLTQTNVQQLQLVHHQRHFSQNNPNNKQPNFSSHQPQVNSPAASDRRHVIHQMVQLPEISRSAERLAVDSAGTSHHFTLQQQAVKNALIHQQQMHFQSALTPRHVTVENTILHPSQVRGMMVLQNTGCTGGTQTAQSNSQDQSQTHQQQATQLQHLQQMHQQLHQNFAAAAANSQIHQQHQLHQIQQRQLQQLQNNQSNSLSPNAIAGQQQYFQANGKQFIPQQGIIGKNAHIRQQQKVDMSRLAQKRGSRGDISENQQEHHGGNYNTSAAAQGQGNVSRMQSKFEKTMDQFSPWD